MARVEQVFFGLFPLRHVAEEHDELAAAVGDSAGHDEQRYEPAIARPADRLATLRLGLAGAVRVEKFGNRPLALGSEQRGQRQSHELASAGTENGAGAMV